MAVTTTTSLSDLIYSKPFEESLLSSMGMPASLLQPGEPSSLREYRDIAASRFR